MKKSLWDVDRELERLKQEILDKAIKTKKPEDDKQSIEHPWHHLSEKELLAVTPVEHQNQVALDNERFFKRRFGFIRPREQREHVIALKDQLDFTDDEIRNLESSKVFKCEKGKNAVVKADRAPYYMGIAMIALLCYQFLPVFALFFFAKLPVTKLLLGAVCCLAFWGIPAYFCHKLSIRPIRTLQQRGLKLGDTLIFNGTKFVRG